MPTVSSLNFYSFAFNGYVFGGQGSVHQVLAVDGLEALPGIRVQDDNRGYFDGMFSGNDFLGGRTLTITILTTAGGGFSAQYNYNLLQQALQPQSSGTTPLQFQLSPAGALQRVNARVRSNATTVDPDYTYGYIRSTFTFFCPDPKYYDDTLQTASLSVSSALGRTYNRVYNLLYNYGLYPTDTTITNNGWATTYPTITLTGPFTNAVLGNATQSLYIGLNGSFSNTDTVVIDLDQRTVTKNGYAARNLLSGGSNWFSAPPGTSKFYFTAIGTIPGTTTGTVSWRSAYI